MISPIEGKRSVFWASPLLSPADIALKAKLHSSLRFIPTERDRVSVRFGQNNSEQTPSGKPQEGDTQATDTKNPDEVSPDQMHREVLEFLQEEPDTLIDYGEENAKLFEQLEASAEELKKPIVEKIVILNQPLVHCIASQWWRFKYPDRNAALRDEDPDFLDMTAEGNMGLLQGIKRFSTSHGTRFSTYASWWIIKHIRNQYYSDGVYSKNTSVLEDIRALRAIRNKIAQQEGKKPDHHTVVRYLLALKTCLEKKPNLEELEALPYEPLLLRLPVLAKPATFKRLVTLLDTELKNSRAQSLDQTLSTEDEKTTRYAMTADKKAKLPDEVASRQEQQARAVKLLQALDQKREAQVMGLRTGLYMVNLTLEEVGLMLGITRERVRQIENKARNKLIQRAHWTNLPQNFPLRSSRKERCWQAICKIGMKGLNTDEQKALASFFGADLSVKRIALLGGTLDNKKPRLSHEEVTDFIREAWRKLLRSRKKTVYPPQKTVSFFAHENALFKQPEFRKNQTNGKGAATVPAAWMGDSSTGADALLITLREQFRQILAQKQAGNKNNLAFSQKASKRDKKVSTKKSAESQTVTRKQSAKKTPPPSFTLPALMPDCHSDLAAALARLSNMEQFVIGHMLFLVREPLPPDALAKETGISKAGLYRMRGAILAKLSGMVDPALLDTKPKRRNDVETILQGLPHNEREQLLQAVREAIPALHLPDAEEEVLTRRLGIRPGTSPESLGEIADSRGSNQESIRIIQKRIITVMQPNFPDLARQLEPILFSRSYKASRLQQAG